MSKSNTSLHISPDLLGAGRLRGLSMDHDSFSAYVVALIRMDIAQPDRVDHQMARRINGFSWKKKEQIDAAMLQKEKDAAAQRSASDLKEDAAADALLGELQGIHPRGLSVVPERRSA